MFPIHFLIAPIRSEQLNPGVNCTKWSQISWYETIFDWSGSESL